VDLPSGRFTVGCFGHLNAAKRLPQLLEGFSLLRERVPEALLLLVGAFSPGLEPTLPEGVVHYDYVDEERLWSLLSATDVSVSLRYPTMGETSGVVVRALSLGRPLVVSDVGWFADLPAEAAVKLPVGGEEIAMLADTLERLARDPARRKAMGAAARALAEGQHELERVAEAYTAALEEAAGGEPVRETVRAEVAAAAAETGLRPGGDALAEIAERLREVGRGR
jgi:glycosyltransferase involved in cell wall biosynthesis